MELKRVLIISPHFPPLNAADMQRVRMSLPYFKEFGWEAEVVTVDPVYSKVTKDELLLQTVPPDITIHRVKAFSRKYTAMAGLGSLALRSMFFYKRKVSRLLKEKKFDLVYFSTTEFPVCILGAYWKRKFGVPYVIDMQDPWHSDYYRDKPRAQRPPKYWLSYRLHKFLEPKAMRHVSGLISVSESYINDLKKRYREIKDIPSAVITFGAFAPDLKIAEDNQQKFERLPDPGKVNIVYAGRGGADMQNAVSELFKAFKKGLESEPNIFGRIKLYFIGTSYAPAGHGKPTIMPVAEEYGISGNMVEITGRISYYHTLATLQQADALFIPGSDDPKYTASKIYPYLLSGKPLLAIFNPQSPALDVMKEYGVKDAYGYGTGCDKEIYQFLKGVAEGQIETASYQPEAIEKYSARNMTHRQCLLFNQVPA
ncbi:MAG TPA: glycosyltransferase [Mucilaginibacter sp.]|nr:glycosyltransferase [Mucilaginibacter sp.]